MPELAGPATSTTVGPGAARRAALAGGRSRSGAGDAALATVRGAAAAPVPGGAGVVLAFRLEPAEAPAARPSLPMTGWKLETEVPD